MEHLDIALKEYGTEEIIGTKHNNRILQYFKDIGHSWVTDDETAWCAAFVNWCLMKADCEYTGRLNARSFLELENAVPSPQLGDVVIFWRIKPDSPYGHVGFFISEKDGYYYVLGGNQGNEVNITKYSKTRLLGIRRPENG